MKKILIVILIGILFSVNTRSIGANTKKEITHIEKVRDLQEARDLLWEDIGIYVFE